VSTSFPRATVVEIPINAPFGGNLLVQASGGTVTVNGPAPSAVGCSPALDGSQIGSESFADLPSQESLAGVAVTGVASVAAGAHIVTVQCNQVDSGHSTEVTLTAFALVTG
jgi:hypothetical protein